MHVLRLWFSWPDGGVWSNLVAAVIGWFGAWLWARTKVRALHLKLNNLHEKMDGLHEKHDRLLDAIEARPPPLDATGTTREPRPT